MLFGQQSHLEVCKQTGQTRQTVSCLKFSTSKSKRQDTPLDMAREIVRCISCVATGGGVDKVALQWPTLSHRLHAVFELQQRRVSARHMHLLKALLSALQPHCLGMMSS